MSVMINKVYFNMKSRRLLKGLLAVSFVSLSAIISMANTTVRTTKSEISNSVKNKSKKEKTITLHLLETSDVHGCFFPYDFINGEPKAGSLARVMTYVNQLRQNASEPVILLDNGDILQGQPICYYYNYVVPQRTNIAASLINYMGYDAETVGNHDVETGHKVYDKWAREVNCPMLGANVVDNATSKPYFKPYTIINKEGLRIAVIGMLTPAIPNWLKEKLWQGLHFEDIAKSAEYWAKYVKDNEHPDLIVGLFHSGWEGGIMTADYQEDAARLVAETIPGFDIVFFGHDHVPHNSTVKGPDGKDVICLDPANNAMRVAQADIVLKKKGKQGYDIISKDGKLIDICQYAPDAQITEHFKADIDSTKAWVNHKIGVFKQAMSTRDCYFGNSAFNDFIMNLQLKITNADITFNAPLSFDAKIDAGDITVGEMFKLYKYDNNLYVMRLTGDEIRKHLEMSYDLWCNTMTSPDDHLLQLRTETRNDSQRMGFKNFLFNFDAAAGIDYVVDVTKLNGQKVKILRMSDGRTFDPKAYYKVAVNSYRGNGGGELLTRGAGIPKDSLKSRIIWESELDQRYYLMQEIEKEGVCDPQPNHNWKFIPEAWAKPAAERDRKLLFGE